MGSFPQISESQLIEFAKTIELTATKVLEGAHLSRRGGEGLEFHSSRPYAEGEDTRFIDWKRFASTDRYFIKNFERQEKTGWSLFVDRSESMLYGQKLEWSKHFAGCLIFLARALGDSWSLYPEQEQDVSAVLKSLLENRAGADFEKKFDSFVPKGNRIVIFSDLFFDPTHLKNKIEDWQAEGFKVCLIQTLDPREIDFSFSDAIEFKDFESSDRLLLDAKSAQRSYREALQSMNREWDAILGDQGFRFPVSTNIAFMEKQLQEFFERL